MYFKHQSTVVSLQMEEGMDGRRKKTSKRTWRGTLVFGVRRGSKHVDSFLRSFSGRTGDGDAVIRSFFRCLLFLFLNKCQGTEHLSWHNRIKVMKK